MSGPIPVPNVKTTREVVQQGSGPKPQQGQSVTVNCTGSVLEASGATKKFWSTKDPGQQPFTFKAGLGQVIKGWDCGVMEMNQGEISKLTIPGDEGYGPNGFPAWGPKDASQQQQQLQQVVAAGGPQQAVLAHFFWVMKKIPPNATLQFEIEVVSIN